MLAPLVHEVRRPPLVFGDEMRQCFGSRRGGMRDGERGRSGGRSQIFNPATIANMVWRVRASQAITSSGGTLVDSIPNEGSLGSGAGANDFTWSGARPKYTAASANFSGRPSVLYDAVQALQTGALSTPIAQPSTFYSYTYFTDTNVAASIAVRLTNAGSSANSASLSITPSTDNLLFAEFGASVVSSALYGKHIACVVYNGASTTLYIDDMSTAVATAGGGGSGACNSIQTKLYNASLAPFEWSEQIGYSGSHNAATRALVKSYFTAVYG